MRSLPVVSILVLLGIAGCATAPDHPRGVFDLSDDPDPSPGTVRPGLPNASHHGGGVGFPGAGVSAGSNGGVGGGAPGS